MGLLVEGRWTDRWYDTEETGGRFVRKDSSFRHRLPEPAEAGRYHLFVSYACPWAHRTLIARALEGLEQAVGVTVVDPIMLENGWTFSQDDPDPVQGARFLYELYQAADPDYTGRVTVPVLWDRATGSIVNNESSEIIRLLDTAFGGELDLYPRALREEIDAVNDLVYPRVNNGVYKAGFATSQEAHEEAVTALFAALDTLEERLSAQRWLVGNRFTEADIRLFTTAIRFDSVYHTHFKCNRNKIAEMPNLWAHTRRIYALPGVAETVNFDHIRRHYYGSHRSLNPRGIIARGPELAL